MRLAVLVAAGYLCGSVPTGVVMVRLLHPEVNLRRVGSGNVGTANIFRNVGTHAAVAVGPLQFAQGLVPVVVARWAGLDQEGLALVAVAAVVGNGWPVWLGFNGGRGIAVATGAVAGLGYAGLFVLLALYLAGALVGEIALGVLAGFVLLPAVELAALGTASAVAAGTILVLLLLRRLEGVGSDLAAGGGTAALLRDRLLFDRRPGRALVGPHMDELG